jgi:glutamate carboxypeptidase
MRSLALAVLLALAGTTFATPLEPLWGLVVKEQPAFVESMKELVAIESGSTDLEGLERIAGVIAKRLAALGGKVEMVEGAASTLSGAPAKTGRMVRATFQGTGTKKILMLAHMDTVYPRGMLQGQPFRIEDGRAYGLGIADDRHGIAVIFHAIALLKAIDFREYGMLTVLINADEEIGSPGSRDLITRLGGEHDAVMSFEGSGLDTDQVRLATSGTASAILTVRGRASHAGSAPERGVNAFYELAHQVLQMRDLSRPEVGVKVNWTMGRAGIVRNMIPPGAVAEADIRVERVADLDGVEQALRERIKNKLLPEASVELEFRRSRPPLQPTEASRALGERAKAVYQELGKTLVVQEKSPGGGTDAAYAALKTKAPVVEGFGLRGFGAHSTNAEYVLLESIQPRLYLATRMIMEISRSR